MNDETTTTTQETVAKTTAAPTTTMRELNHQIGHRIYLVAKLNAEISTLLQAVDKVTTTDHEPPTAA